MNDKEFFDRAVLAFIQQISSVDGNTHEYYYRDYSAIEKAEDLLKRRNAKLKDLGLDHD